MSASTPSANTETDMIRSQNSLKIRHSLLLLLAALIWGTTFVAQSIAARSISPFTYNFCRFYVGAIVLLPVAVLVGKRDPLAPNYTGIPIPGMRPKESRLRDVRTCGIACGVLLFLAGGFQQAGLEYTTAGKSGFITALYIILVPVFGLFLHKKCPPVVWISVILAVIGFYLLSVKEGFSVNRGDLLTLCSSCLFAMHILTVDHFIPRVNGIQLSCIQFIVAGTLSLFPAFLLETPSVSSIVQCIWPILYAGILSSGVAYTLQIVGQRGLNPTLASLLMSLESVISAISGWIVLGDSMSPKELFGCALVFSGVILAQLPSIRKLK
ncbi:MAG: DMT family transporter [Bilifractor sp.]|jgi:drug/metabolite transporter (DMT)-like permease